MMHLPDVPQPYSALELAAVRPILERFNRPQSPVRRLLATLDEATQPR